MGLCCKNISPIFLFIRQAQRRNFRTEKSIGFVHFALIKFKLT